MKLRYAAAAVLLFIKKQTRRFIFSRRDKQPNTRPVWSVSDAGSDPGGGRASTAGGGGLLLENQSTHWLYLLYYVDIFISYDFYSEH